MSETSTTSPTDKMPTDNQLVGNLLNDSNSEEGANEEPSRNFPQIQGPSYIHKPAIRLNIIQQQPINRSGSAPPQEQELDFSPAQKDRAFIGTRDYYEYYHSLKPKDPRLPKPTFKPSIGIVPVKLELQKIRGPNEERDEEEERKREQETLVDRIQKDFPETPSPIFALRRAQMRMGEPIESLFKKQMEDEFTSKMESLNIDNSEEGEFPPNQLTDELIEKAFSPVVRTPSKHNRSKSPRVNSPSNKSSFAKMVEPPPGLSPVSKQRFYAEAETHKKGYMEEIKKTSNMASGSPMSSGYSNYGANSTPLSTFSDYTQLKPQMPIAPQNPPQFLQGVNNMYYPNMHPMQMGMPSMYPPPYQHHQYMGGMGSMYPNMGHGYYGGYMPQQHPSMMPHYSGSLPIMNTMMSSPLPTMSPYGMPNQPMGMSPYMHKSPGYDINMQSQGSGYTNSFGMSQVRPQAPAKLSPNKTLFGSPSTNSAAIPISKFVEDFRYKLNLNKTVELSEIIGHIVELAQDQYGSRYIQQKLESASEVEKAAIFDEIKTQPFKLITDVFGNYVVQKTLELGTPEQRKDLISKLLRSIFDLSQHMYGCRVVQKAIQVAELDQQLEIVNELRGSLQKCVEDQNGNHVIQKCVECIPEEHIRFIIKAFEDRVFETAVHAYGCRVIQRVLEFCKDPQVIKKGILKNIVELSKDQYGNYVIQHLLQHGNPDEVLFVVEILQKDLYALSIHKYASNVVEKCLTYAPHYKKVQILDALTQNLNEPDCPLIMLMKDRFANYVIQKAIEIADEPRKIAMVKRILVCDPAMKRQNNFSRHVFSYIEKIVASNSSPPVDSNLNN